MTAHREKAATITQHRIEWFARYYFANQSWGVFHVCLDDGNYKLGANTDWRAEWSAELVEMVTWFEKLTPSQRCRLGKKSEQLARNPLFPKWMYAKCVGPISKHGANSALELG